jgi:hypothetical protein
VCVCVFGRGWVVAVVWIEIGHMTHAVLDAVCKVSSILHRFKVQSFGLAGPAFLIARKIGTFSTLQPNCATRLIWHEIVGLSSQNRPIHVHAVYGKNRMKLQCKRM